ncbi:MAG: hypothetical protein WD000_02280 [Thermodesulfobacteriota bacterium]
MIGPVMSRSRPAGSNTSSPRQTPKHRKSITVSLGEETNHITIFYGEITQDIMVGYVYHRNLGNRFARTKLERITDSLEDMIKSYIRL